MVDTLVVEQCPLQDVNVLLTTFPSPPKEEKEKAVKD